MGIVRLLEKPVLELRFAEELDVVGKKRVARREIVEAARRPDFIALENARIAFDRLHQRACLTLFSRRALAKTAATQSGPELVDAVGRRGEIVLGEVIGVHRQVDVDPLESGHHPIDALEQSLEDITGSKVP